MNGKAEVEVALELWESWEIPLLFRLALAPLPVVLASCGPAVPSLDVDGGFADAPVVVVPPTRVADDSRDTRLLLQLRWIEPMEGVGHVVEATAHDQRTGILRWTHTFLPPGSFETFSESGMTVDPRDGQLAFQASGVTPATMVTLDPRLFTIARIDFPAIDSGHRDEDIGWLGISCCAVPSVIGGEVLLREGTPSHVRYTRGGESVQPDLPPLDLTAAHRGPARTLVLDGTRLLGPTVEWMDYFGEPVFVLRRDDSGVDDVYLVEPETGAVVGTGRRVPPPGVPPLTNGIDRQLVDRDGRLYYRDGDYVNAEPIHRAGMDGTTDELVLDWGDEGSCLLTRIVAVGPEGHVLSRQRPDPGWRTAPDGVVCLFGPDGALVLRLPEDPDRVWVGFSDPIHWL